MDRQVAKRPASGLGAGGSVKLQVLGVIFRVDRRHFQNCPFPLLERFYST